MEHKQDPVEGILFGICIVLIALCVVMMVGSCVSFAHREKEMKADSCKLVSEVKTGKKNYCGKACWTDEVRKEYSCNSGTKVITE